MSNFREHTKLQTSSFPCLIFCFHSYVSLQYANDDCCLMLIANKSDKDDRQVDKARGEKVWSLNILSRTTQYSAVKIVLSKERTFHHFHLLLDFSASSGIRNTFLRNECKGV